MRLGLPEGGVVRVVRIRGPRVQDRGADPALGGASGLAVGLVQHRQVRDRLQGGHEAVRLGARQPHGAGQVGGALHVDAAGHLGHLELEAGEVALGHAAVAQRLEVGVEALLGDPETRAQLRPVHPTGPVGQPHDVQQAAHEVLARVAGAAPDGRGERHLEQGRVGGTGVGLRRGGQARADAVGQVRVRGRGHGPAQQAADLRGEAVLARSGGGLPELPVGPRCGAVLDPGLGGLTDRADALTPAGREPHPDPLGVGLPGQARHEAGVVVVLGTAGGVRRPLDAARLPLHPGEPEAALGAAVEVPAGEVPAAAHEGEEPGPHGAPGGPPPRVAVGEAQHGLVGHGLGEGLEPGVGPGHEGVVPGQLVVAREVGGRLEQQAHGADDVGAQRRVAPQAPRPHEGAALVHGQVEVAQQQRVADDAVPHPRLALVEARGFEGLQRDPHGAQHAAVPLEELLEGGVREPLVADDLPSDPVTLEAVRRREQQPQQRDDALGGLVAGAPRGGWGHGARGQSTETRSQTKMSVSFGPIAEPAPRAP